MATIIIDGTEEAQQEGLLYKDFIITYPGCYLKRDDGVSIRVPDTLLETGRGYTLIRPSADGAQNNLPPRRTGTVHLLRFKSNVEFRTYNDLERAIESNEKWKKSLRYADFEVKIKEGEILRPFPRDMDGLPTENVKIIVVLLCSSFSKQASKPEQALNSIGVTNFKNIASIPICSHLFPECTSIPLKILQEEAGKVVTNLLDRADVINRKLASEYTMREFVSPVLIGALKSIIRHDRTRFGNGTLSMVCEKRIIGKLAHGPVDYSFVFDCLDLVLTEAKREDLDLGIVQNLLQQRACQEFLANTLIDYDAIQDERKRMFAEAFEDVSQTPTCGITSTGGKWVLCRTTCVRDEGTGKVVTDVSISETIEVDLANVNAAELTKLLSRIAQLVLTQVDNVATNNRLAERRRRIIPTNNATVSLQMLEHDRAEDVELILSQGEDEDEEAENFD
eukprot:gene38885-47298_t